MQDQRETDPLVRHCGKQRIARVGEDVLDIALRGELTRQELLDLIDARQALTDGLRYFLIVCRLAAFERISMATGRVLANAPDPRPQALLFLGASYHTEMLARMIIRSASLFARQRSRVQFASTEDDMHSWIQQMRQALVAECG